MAISEYYSDEELISELQMFFSIEENDTIDFQAVLGQIVEIDEDTFQVNIKNRTFQFDKTFCDVIEVE